MRKIAVILILAALLPSCTTTYYLVRHAERLDNSEDSPLSQAGFARANILRDTLIDKHVAHIYASTKIRTQQTAKPLADALGFAQGQAENYTTYTYPAADNYAGLIADLKVVRGKNVLVVGHSDNIPVVIEALCGQIVSIPGNDFDNLFVVSIRRWCNKTTKSFAAKTYGAPSP
ncbi:MAG: histidine phosphatase family protein [Saprospirales bacterium]|jgi:phosphohistidine phosphatase SixA|nr:histidine phosphatase family protein [Saprospirales bacterium]